MFKKGRSKILIWYWGRVGGGPLMTLLLARRLAHEGYQTNLALSLSEQNELIQVFHGLDLSISTVRTWEGTPIVARLLQAGVRLRREFKRQLAAHEPASIVVPMIFGAAMPLLLLERGIAERFIYVVHDVRSHPGERISTEHNIAQFCLLRMASKLVAVSETVKRELISVYPRAEGRIVVEPLAGLYESKHGPRAALRDRPLRLLAPGRLVKYKGYERVAQALDLIDRDSVQVTIAGDGPERQGVERLFSHRANVAIRTDWLSASERQHLFRNHDVLLCAHDSASQSGLICEALSYSMPSIVTPVGALPEQIGFGKAGWVTPNLSAQALAKLIWEVHRDKAAYRAASAGCLEVLAAARQASQWANTLGLT
jgi:glycosyltransferase involved in cell wall biosynthesis